MKDFSNLDGIRASMQDLIESAYNKGYKHGLRDAEGEEKTEPSSDRYQEGYQRGAIDAWDTAVKLHGLKLKELNEIFALNWERKKDAVSYVLQTFYPDEVADAINSQRRTGEKVLFHVNDEVLHEGKQYFVCLTNYEGGDNDNVLVEGWDGYAAFRMTKRESSVIQ